MVIVNTTVPNATTTTLLLGVATVVSQSILLREAMAAMGGSELALGLVMALWLTGMGLGARLGVRLGPQGFAQILPTVTLVAAAAGMVLFRAAPSIVGATAGESLTSWNAVWLWAVAILPAACVGGVAFPILAGSLGETGAGRAYAIEAAGALVGGMALTFALIRFGSAVSLLVAIGAVAGTQVWHRHRAAAVLVLAACVGLASPAGDSLARATWRWAGHPGDLGNWAETDHQRIEASTGPPTAVYADGRLVASYPDPYTVPPRTHLMMLLHPEPRRVLAVGSAADGSVEAMIRHHLEVLVIVEEDPMLSSLLGRWYGDAYRQALDHPSIRISRADPLNVVADTEDLDLMILADGDPTTLRANRTRTAEFFQRCRRALNASGVLVVRVGVSDTYLGGTAGELLATLVSTLKEAFPTVTALPGEQILLIAGGPDAKVSVDVEELEHRLLGRSELSATLPPAMLPLLADPTRTTDLAAFVATASALPNTIGHPRAVALASVLHEARSRTTLAQATEGLRQRGPRVMLWVLAVVLTLVLAAAAGSRRRTRVVATAWVVGAVSMGWWLLLLAIWQTTRGAIYAEIGALTGLTMAGVAIGGRLGQRFEQPRLALPRILFCGVAVSLLIAFGFPLRSPIVLVPLIMTICGVLTGAAFPALAILAGDGSSRRGAGIAFSADEIGAAVAALIIGTAAIPVVGMTWSALGLALLGLAAIPAAARA